MSGFSNLRRALTPKSGGVVLAFVLAFLLEMVKTVGQVVTAVFLLIVFFAAIGFGIYGLHHLAGRFLG